MENEMNYANLDIDTFIRVIDHLHDEIMIWDDKYNVLYVNKACYKHYGMSPEEIVGKNFFDLTDINHYWAPSTLPYVYKEKKAVIQHQKTHIGAEITTISVPIKNEKGDVEFVIMSARDNYDELELLLSHEKKDAIAYNISDKYKIIHRSNEMKEVVRLAQKIASIKSPSLILGETGTGKSLLAKYMHRCSDRKEKPFININCAAISSNLIESELFGYKKGAFSGANQDGKKGLIELANGGTLFLDEIVEIPYKLQAKLLQVIQDEEFIPIGATKSVKVDIKIISATNCDLKKMVELDNFREDLYHRLNVFEIVIPPLRERKEDIITLAYHFLNKFNKKYGKNHEFLKEALEVMCNYSWAGNIRELSHLIERLVFTVNDEVIQTWHLPKHFYEFKPTQNKCFMNSGTLDDAKLLLEEEMIKDAYKRFGSTRKVAKELAISQSRACRLIKKYVAE